ncbi:MAG: hypothetical protein CL674_03240 [Bdellovibrionaceae bacterium]|nr:hypothetical protein [Pseudobdellovibrionaceae bacterium]|tara:strand:+ start:1134 stop:1703 length:570 start_codon:yes stop_codon:yes gene_type:complete
MKYLLLLCLFSISSWGQCLVLDKDSFDFKFTGYKFTEKAGVTGSFKKIEYQTPTKGELKDILSKASLAIDTTSIDAGNEARNTNISDSLFKSLVNGKSISAKATKVDTKKKLVYVDLTMGGKTQEVALNYSYKDSILQIEGSIDLLKLGFNKAFNALAEKCGPLHTGKDGKAKTWSDVKILLTAKANKC